MQANNSDVVFIRQLTVDTVIGVYDWEQSIKQTLVFDIDLGLHTAAAAQDDDLTNTIDYMAVATQITDYVHRSQCGLIETVAEQCAAMLLRDYPALWVKLSVNKIGAVSAATGGVGVTIERHQANDVIVSLGSNTEDAEQKLRQAATLLGHHFPTIRFSPCYLTDLVAEDGQAAINCTAIFSTADQVYRIHAMLKHIENQCGRQRHTDHRGPHALDLDIISFGRTACVDAASNINLPVPALNTLPYVLGPLHDIVPGTTLPTYSNTIAELWQACADKHICREKLSLDLNKV